MTQLTHSSKMHLLIDPPCAIAPLTDQSSEDAPLPAPFEPGFFGDGNKVFALLDGSMIPNLDAFLESSGASHDSLFDPPDPGGEEEDMRVVGPWLVELALDHPLSRNLLTRSDAPWHLWGRCNAVFLRSGVSLADLRKHLRRFVRMRMPDESLPFFRFWDGQVFGDYLRGCVDRPDRAARFFGAKPDAPALVSEFWVPAEAGLDTLEAVRLEGHPATLGDVPGQAFDATDVALIAAAADRRLVAGLAGQLQPKFAALDPDQADQATPYADSALRFIRRYGAGGSTDLQRDCIELAMLAFLLGPNWAAVIHGPLMKERLIPISQRIAQLRESYFSALLRVPPPAREDEA